MITLREARKEAFLSIRDLEQVSRVSRRTILRIELNQLSPRLATRRMLAKAFGYTLTDIRWPLERLSLNPLILESHDWHNGISLEEAREIPIEEILEQIAAPTLPALPPDNNWYGLDRYIAGECPRCGSDLSKMPLIRRYNPEVDRLGAGMPKCLLAPVRRMGWLTSWFCTCGYTAHGSATDKQVKAWGEMFGGWNELKSNRDE